MEIGFWIILYFLLVTPAVTVRLSTHIIRSGYDDDSQNYSVMELFLKAHPQWKFYHVHLVR